VKTLMRRMEIEALYRRPRTTKPEPGHKIYPYLLRGVEITRHARTICRSPGRRRKETPGDLEQYPLSVISALAERAVAALVPRGDRFDAGGRRAVLLHDARAFLHTRYFDTAPHVRLISERLRLPQRCVFQRASNRKCRS
jgi:hypothetical protein